MNKQAMFDFAIEQRDTWQETKDETYRVAWETARYMIQIGGLWDDYRKYLADLSEGKIMNSDRIEMFESGYTEDNKPLYTVVVYNEDGKEFGRINDISMEKAVKVITGYWLRVPIKE